MSKTTTLGFLFMGNLFKFDGRTYKAGKPIEGTNGYIACVDIETHKVKRFYIDTTVETLEGGAEV